MKCFLVSLYSAVLVVTNSVFSLANVPLASPAALFPAVTLICAFFRLILEQMNDLFVRRSDMLVVSHRKETNLVLKVLLRFLAGYVNFERTKIVLFTLLTGSDSLNSSLNMVVASAK